MRTRAGFTQTVKGLAVAHYRDGLAHKKRFHAKEECLAHQAKDDKLGTSEVHYNY